MWYILCCIVYNKLKIHVIILLRPLSRIPNSANYGGGRGVPPCPGWQSPLLQRCLLMAHFCFRLPTIMIQAWVLPYWLVFLPSFYLKVILISWTIKNPISEYKNLIYTALYIYIYTHFCEQTFLSIWHSKWGFFWPNLQFAKHFIAESTQWGRSSARKQREGGREERLISLKYNSKGRSNRAFFLFFALVTFAFYSCSSKKLRAANMRRRIPLWESYKSHMKWLKDIHLPHDTPGQWTSIAGIWNGVSLHYAGLTYK